MTLYEKPVTIGDLLKSEENAMLSRESVTITNNTGAEIALVVGHPLDLAGTLDARTAVPVIAANIANTDAILLEHAVLADGESRKLPALVRGPAAINRDVLPENDYDGDPITLANYITRIQAIGIVVRVEPSIQAEQTT
jgi:hypothetical protein